MSSAEVTVARRAPEDLAPGEVAAWRALAGAVADATLFMWPASFEAWRGTIGAGIDCAVLLARRGGELVGVLPVMRTRMWRGPAFAPRIDYGPFDSDLAGGRRPFPVRQLSSVVSWRGLSVRPTLLCHDRDRPEVARAMAGALARTAGVDQIVLPVREGDEGAWLEGFRAAGCRPWLHDLGRNVLTLEHVRPVEEMLGAQGKNFRRNVRRAQAAAADSGLVFRIVEGCDEVMAHRELIARIAAESWKGKTDGGGPVAISYAGDQRRYVEALLAAEGSGLEPVLCLGEIAGDPVQAALTFRHGATLAGLLTFRRDVPAASSAGLLAKLALVDWCAAAGLRRFDLNATQDWLRHLSDSRHRLLNVAAFRPTARGLAYDLIARLRRSRLGGAGS